MKPKRCHILQNPLPQAIANVVKVVLALAARDFILCHRGEAVSWFEPGACG